MLCWQGGEGSNGSGAGLWGMLGAALDWALGAALGGAPLHPLDQERPRQHPLGHPAWADDAWVAALGTLAGQAIAPMPPSAASLVADEAESGCAVVSVMAQGLATLDRDFLAPAAEALRTGRLQRLTVAADDRAVGVTAGDRHRFWRPERDLLSALLEGRA